MRPIVPLLSTSRIPCTAASAVMPPPMIRYLKLGMGEGALSWRNLQLGLSIDSFRDWPIRRLALLSVQGISGIFRNARVVKDLYRRRWTKIGIIFQDPNDFLIGSD